ncbi:MAG TPA: TrbC/VirB2 family protein [Steroidobacteraceae bacterium]|jgi:type IV secretion system protein VirB2
MNRYTSASSCVGDAACLGAALLSCSTSVLGQQSVFNTGANALVTWGLTIATPVAILVVIVVGMAAAIGKISWAWVIGAVIGIAVIFGSEQLVTWVRGLFGV